VLQGDNTAPGVGARIFELFPEQQTYQQTAKVQAQKVVEYQIEEKSMAPTEVHKEAVNGIMMWVSAEILGAVEFAMTDRVRCW
jgi:hypothetical protein